MNLNIGSLVRRVTSISVMPQASYMPSLKTWLLIYRLTSMFSYSLQQIHLSLCLTYIFYNLFFLLWQSSRHVLHKYANEDVSLGSWFIGLDAEHIDDRRLCCGTPPGNLIFPPLLHN